MPVLPQFVKLPSGWIDKGGLKAFRWGPGGGDEIAAIMVLCVIAHHIDRQSGTATINYDRLMEAAGLSRAKVAAALKILRMRDILEGGTEGRSNYRLVGYNPDRGWSMFPARGLYQYDVVDAFREFRLRRRSELDALKLYLLFAARRDNRSQVAKIGYHKIAEHTGVTTNYIRPAISVLAANNLIHVEHVTATGSDVGVVNAYRLAHLPRRFPSQGGTPLAGGGVEIASV